MQLADLTLRERDDPHVRKAQSLVDGSNVLLVATDAVERLSINKVELTIRGVQQQRLDTGSSQAGS